ncbi:MAG: YggS family pyridoxal phosphate-dependent enzyme [Rhodospirillaceae bacterium]|nr:YggS family pyridoxal phosphate-dependent enzyme [Rhodospirillaceae bacterium]
MNESSTTPATRALADVANRIADAARKAGRGASDVTLIAVTKTHGAARILPAIAAGHCHFGENRVQEALEKWPELKAQTPGLCVHLIGPLQTNKVRDAVALFDVIHTVDRARLAEKLSAEMERQDRRLPCFIQVNTGREPQKAGIDPADLDAFVTACRRTWRLPLAGLMCIPPVDEEAALHFAFLRELARRNDLAQLSMGMSGDYELAVAFGATHVRVGSAIFGARE